MAEWLGSALQKQLQRFESASDLQKRIPVCISKLGFFFYTNPKLALGFGVEGKSPVASDSEIQGFFSGAAPTFWITDWNEVILKVDGGGSGLQFWLAFCVLINVPLKNCIFAL